MATYPSEHSKIQEYFSGTTVFVTGGTGFLGRLLIEKLLRSCKDIKKIYILIRSRKGQSCQERFEHYFDDLIYENLKCANPHAMHKLFFISGDCSLPNLGIDDKSREKLINEVNCVFHCAATVRFDEKLKKAVHINIRGTSDILKLSKMMKQLKSIIHVSTAYSFCIRQEIEEKFYSPSFTGSQLMSFVETLDDELLDKILPVILGKWPNTYSLTKSVAEDVVRTEGANLPLGIVRPSIVLSTFKDPVDGWIDNLYGPTGFCAWFSIGLMHIMPCDPNCFTDIIPADYVINAIIAVAWDVGLNKKLNRTESSMKNSKDNETKKEITIYNIVNSPQNLISWGRFFKLMSHCFEKSPPAGQLWHSFCFTNSNKYIYLLLHYFLHIVPAHILDFISICLNRKANLVNIYKKIKQYAGIMKYFSCHQWTFSNINTTQLWEKLNLEDKMSFEFDLANIDWNIYLQSYAKGIRLYILKDSLDTTRGGHKMRLSLKIMHYIVVICMGLVLLTILWYFVKLMK